MSGTPEVTARQSQKIRLLVDAGKTPDEAFAIVLGREPEKGEVKPKKKANTEPATKKKLRDWLEEQNIEVVREYQFHPDRRWRFDWYLPNHDIAIEYEGFMTKGANVGHNSITGIRRDIEKYNEAQAMGIRVFRASAENIRTGDFFSLMNRVLETA